MEGGAGPLAWEVAGVWQGGGLGLTQRQPRVLANDRCGAGAGIAPRLPGLGSSLPRAGASPPGERVSGPRGPRRPVDASCPTRSPAKRRGRQCPSRDAADSSGLASALGPAPRPPADDAFRFLSMTVQDGNRYIQEGRGVGGWGVGVRVGVGEGGPERTASASSQPPTRLWRGRGGRAHGAGPRGQGAAIRGARRQPFILSNRASMFNAHPPKICNPSNNDNNLQCL